MASTKRECLRSTVFKAVAQSRTLMRDQLLAWGLVSTPYLPAAPTHVPGMERTIIV